MIWWMQVASIIYSAILIRAGSYYSVRFTISYLMISAYHELNDARLFRAGPINTHSFFFRRSTIVEN